MKLVRSTTLTGLGPFVAETGISGIQQGHSYPGLPKGYRLAVCQPTVFNLVGTLISASLRVGSKSDNAHPTASDVHPTMRIDNHTPLDQTWIPIPI
jgi:hypothetical protein